MKVSEIFETINDIEQLHNILTTNNYHPTDVEISEICDLLWDYRNELLRKEVKC